MGCAAERLPRDEWLWVNLVGDFITQQGPAKPFLDRLVEKRLCCATPNKRKHMDYDKILSFLATPQTTDQEADLKAAQEINQRLVDAANSLSREEVQALSLRAVSVQKELARLSIQTTKELMHSWQALSQIKNPNASQKSDLEAFWRRFWAASNLLVLASAQGLQPWMEGLLDQQLTEGTWLSSQQMFYGVPAVTIRTWWSVGRSGESLVPILRSAYRSAKNPYHVMDAGSSLLVFAAFQPTRKVEISKLLLRSGDSDQSRQRAGQFLSGTLDNLENIKQAHLKKGQAAVAKNADKFPEGSPFRYTKLEDVPESLAVQAAFHEDNDYLNQEEDLVSLVSAIPWLPEAKLEDLYLPEAYLAPLRRPWRLEDTQDLFTRFKVYFGAHTPVRVVQTQGRNELCACGSGKKFKKCHGA